MPFSAGVFSRVYNWVTDKNNSINITASRMDTEMNGMATGLSTCILKDGTQTVTANIPFAGFKLTGVGAGTAATDAANLSQIQNQTSNWVASGGTVDVITASYSPAVTSLVDGMELDFRATGANTSTTPTFSPNGLTARTITQKGGSALVAGSISAANFEAKLRYNLANTRWELMNPVSVIGNNSVTNAMLAQMTANTVKGNNTGSTANAADIALTTSTILGMGSSGNIAALTATSPLVIGASAITFNASQITNSLGADVTLTTQNTFYDGPSVAQGTSGVWFVSGTVTLIDTGGNALFYTKLYDGTTIIASAATASNGSNNPITVTLSAFISSPAGNLRIACANGTRGTSGSIGKNISGLNKDSTITAIRIG